MGILTHRVNKPPLADICLQRPPDLGRRHFGLKWFFSLLTTKAKSLNRLWVLPPFSEYNSAGHPKQVLPVTTSLDAKGIFVSKPAERRNGIRLVSRGRERTPPLSPSLRKRGQGELAIGLRHAGMISSFKEVMHSRSISLGNPNVNLSP